MKRIILHHSNGTKSICNYHFRKTFEYGQDVSNFESFVFKHRYDENFDMVFRTRFTGRFVLSIAVAIMLTATLIIF